MKYKKQSHENMDYTAYMWYSVEDFVGKEETTMAKNGKLDFSLDKNPYYIMSKIDVGQYPQEFWDVNETITELSYLTHSYFRYYGKFPSKIGKLIVEDLDGRKKISPKNDFVFDNYAGSGTTLVEAKLRNYDSFGIDINPFAVLACKVKTRNYNVSLLRNYWAELFNEISAYNYALLPTGEQQLIFVDISNEMVSAIKSEVDTFKANNMDAEKWFTEKTIIGLAIIKCLLLKRQESKERDFFELAYFAIIRRVSTAHDGEVRPHVNKKKRERNVMDAYAKKVSEMIDLMVEWNRATKDFVISDAILCNNASRDGVYNYINELRARTNKELGLVVSHPPYLNCFDYIPVYKLKFMWAIGFKDIFFGYDYKEIKNMEIKSYPACTSENIEKYFSHNRKVYETVFDNLRHGGYCCVVIGDCTLQNNLFEVHKAFITMLEDIGFATDKIAYRSTAYGIGQYAYRYRADYNEDANRKKDGVLFFRKP